MQALLTFAGIPYTARAAAQRPNDFDTNFDVAHQLASWANRFDEAEPFVERVIQIAAEEVHELKGYEATWARLFRAHRAWMSGDVAAMREGLDRWAERLPKTPAHVFSGTRSALRDGYRGLGLNSELSRLELTDSFWLGVDAYLKHDGEAVRRYLSGPWPKGGDWSGEVERYADTVDAIAVLRHELLEASDDARTPAFTLSDVDLYNLYSCCEFCADDDSDDVTDEQKWAYDMLGRINVYREAAPTLYVATPKALTEVHDAPDFETFTSDRIELIRNRCAFLYGLGDASINASYQDLSHMELVSSFGWVLTLHDETEGRIDWPEDCRK